MSLDDREDVVEIMGHACGQLADAFHLLRLEQLALQHKTFGNVLCQQQPVRTPTKRHGNKRDQHVPDDTGLTA